MYLFAIRIDFLNQNGIELLHNTRKRAQTFVLECFDHCLSSATISACHRPPPLPQHLRRWDEKNTPRRHIRHRRLATTTTPKNKRGDRQGEGKLSMQHVFHYKHLALTNWSLLSTGHVLTSTSEGTLQSLLVMSIICLALELCHVENALQTSST
jgi:hypothetical protein